RSGAYALDDVLGGHRVRVGEELGDAQVFGQLVLERQQDRLLDAAGSLASSAEHPASEAVDHRAATAQGDVVIQGALRGVVIAKRTNECLETIGFELFQIDVVRA